MSTKAIRMALGFLSRGMPTERGLAEPALKEVEAIERAAKAFATPVGQTTIITTNAFVRLMESIAKDAP